MYYVLLFILQVKMASCCKSQTFVAQRNKGTSNAEPYDSERTSTITYKLNRLYLWSHIICYHQSTRLLMSSS